MIRITGGRRKGMVLSAPRGLTTRPATARVRQWIFDVLGQSVEGRVLDLFAGTGAIGIEALSRGAAHAVFVETSGAALAALQQNLSRTGFEGSAEIVRQDVPRAAQRLLREGRRFDLCFCDPPYGWEGLEGLLEQSVLDLVDGGGTLVVEHRGEHPLAPRGLPPDRQKDFGDTVLSLWDRSTEARED